MGFLGPFVPIVRRVSLSPMKGHSDHQERTRVLPGAGPVPAAWALNAASLAAEPVNRIVAAWRGSRASPPHPLHSRTPAVVRIASNQGRCIPERLPRKTALDARRDIRFIERRIPDRQQPVGGRRGLSSPIRSRSVDR